LNFTHFDDDDYKADTPSLGIKMPTSTKVLNYSIEFKKYPRSDVDSNGRLEDMEDRDLIVLGKTYKLLNAYNYSSYTKFELMRGSATETINLNEEKTVTVEGKSYTVTLIYVDATYTQYTVVDSKGNTQTTTKLAKGGTYKLLDGTQLGVTDLSYQAFSGGVMSAQFTIGANKLTIEDTQPLEIDDTDVNEITCYISKTDAGSGKQDIKSITLEWKTDDDMFIAKDSTMVLPGFKTLKLEYGSFIAPCEEKVQVKNTDSYGVEIVVPIKDGDTPGIGILNGNATDFLYVGRSKDGDKNFLRTSTTVTGTTLTFDRDIDKYFVASWNDSTSAESYLLEVSSITESDNKNYTTVRNVVTGSNVGENKQETNTITIGSGVELTVGEIHKNDNTVVLTINTGGSFNRIYTKGGLTIYLPINATEGDQALDPVSGAVSTNWNILTNGSENNTYAGSYILKMVEEDKDGNLGSGSILNITLDQSGSSSEGEADEVVADDSGFSDGNYREVGDSNIYDGYVHSDLGTKIEFKKPTSGTNSLDVIYHCEQSYAEIFLTAPETVITPSTGTTELGSVTYKDNELTDTAKAKNLIVVGGSCVNTVAAEILGGSLCEADFTAKTGVGANQFLVQVVASPYSSSKVAMLVAGYEAEDTKKAVTYVTKEAPSTAVGTNLKKVTATYADVA